MGRARACCTRICTSTVRQHLAAGAVGHGALGFGIILGWSSAAIPSLVESKDLGDLSATEKYWIANIAILGAILSTVLTGYIIDKIGHRLSILILSFPFLVGGILLAFSNSVALLCAGRFIAGYAGGAFSVIIPLYITEYAEDRIRGHVGYSFLQQLLTGALFVAIFSKVSWNLLGLKCFPLAIVLFVATYFLPESPRYLFMKGENVRAVAALKWFRITTEPDKIEEETKDIEQRVEKLNGERLSSNKPWLWVPLLKPIGISAGLMTFQQLSCGSNFILRTISVSEVVGGSGLSPDAVSLTVAIIPLVTLIISSGFVDRIGRRILLLSSCTLMGLGSAALGFCFYAQAGADPSVVDRLLWFRVISFATYIFAYSFGLGPISWLLMGEIMPDRARGLGAGVVAFINWLLAFFLIKFFGLFVYLLTVSGTFWILSLVCTGGLVFSYFFVPETRGKSFNEIQESFERRPSAIGTTGHVQYSPVLQESLA